MEHRLSVRAPLNQNVAIYYNSLGLLQGQAVDVSRHGMFIRTGRLALPLHALVEIVVPLKQQSSGPVRTSAMVVRVSSNGVGVMFGNEMDILTLQTDEIINADVEERRTAISSLRELNICCLLR